MAERLPNGWLAQTCKLYALNKALRGLKGKARTIYSDSSYAYVVHTFGKIWDERGLINSRGEELIKQALTNSMLPDEIAVVLVNGHQKGSSFEAVGNRLADEAALQSELGEQLYIVTPKLPTPKRIPAFTEWEFEELKRLGAIKTDEGRWLLPDQREMLSKQVMREVMAVLHQGSHWGIQAMCDKMKTVWVYRKVHQSKTNFRKMYNL